MNPTPHTWVSTATGRCQHAVRGWPCGVVLTMCGVVLVSHSAAAPDTERCAKCQAAIEREGAR